MTDIVERLSVKLPYGSISPLYLQEAREEIERLRAENAALRNNLEHALRNNRENCRQP